MRRLLLSLAVLACAGCQSRPLPPAVLQGDDAGIAGLAGKWEGEYWGADNGRRGAIDFSLIGGRDSVYGEVTMLDPRGAATQPADAAAQHNIHATSARALAISFVRVSGGAVAGRLEPYVAPDCGCVVSTTFTGGVRGDTIAGTFVTRYPAGRADDGRWRVRRVGSVSPSSRP